MVFATIMAITGIMLFQEIMIFTAAPRRYGYYGIPYFARNCDVFGYYENYIEIFLDTFFLNFSLDKLFP